MGKADSLSRRPDWEIGVEKDNENETMIKLKWLEVRKTKVIEIIVDRVDLLEEVRKSKVKDDKVIKVVEEMKQARVKMLRDEKWYHKWSLTICDRCFDTSKSSKKQN